MGSREMPMAPSTSLVRKREPRAPPARSAAMRTRERARTRPKTRKARKAKAERAKRRMKEEVSSGWIGARREPRVKRAAARRTIESPPRTSQNFGGRFLGLDMIQGKRHSGVAVKEPSDSVQTLTRETGPCARKTMMR